MAVSLPQFDEYEKKEKCGLFGIWGTDKLSQICYQGLFAQQHRGQESAGIVVSDGTSASTATPAWAWSARSSRRASSRKSSSAIGGIGHVRYSTTGSSKLCNAQPLLRQYLMGPVAVAHNGNLINAALLRKEYEQHGHIFQSTTDTEIIVHLLAKPSHVEKHDPLPHVLKHLQGAFSLLFLFPNRIEACRDPWGIRPLSLGRTAEGHCCVASETLRIRCDRRRIYPRHRARRDRPHRRHRRHQPPIRRPRRRKARAASSSTSISPTPPATSSARTSTSRAKQWAGNWRANPASKPTASCPCPTPAAAPRWATPRNPASRSRKESSPTASSAARSSCPARSPATARCA